LGGGTGTGAKPVVAELTRSLKRTYQLLRHNPFTIEMSRREKAREAIKLLAESCDSVVIMITQS